MSRSGKNLADKLFPVDDVDDDLLIIDIPPEKRRLHTETYDFSISTIVDLLRNNSVVVPPFQRNYVWNRSQASRLIESLIIQCPIPVIYLNQEKDEVLSVIDGNQRLTSIKLFLDDEFELQGLTAYPELDGLRFSELDPRFRRHISNRTLRCITILKETHPQIKFDVFERINTGAVQLNPQEVRHGLYHGKLMQLIDDLSDEKVWKSISGHRNDNRMKGSELVLRFLALNVNRRKYKKPLKNFLNEFCSEYYDLTEDLELEWKRKFITVVEAVNYVFGNKSFKILNSKLEPSVKNVNSALFDAVMVGFAVNDINRDQLVGLDKEDFLSKFFALTQEDEFKKSITSGTSATASVNYRIERFCDFLNKEL